MGLKWRPVVLLFLRQFEKVIYQLELEYGINKLSCCVFVATFLKIKKLNCILSFHP